MNRMLRCAALGASALATGAISGCSGPSLEGAPPPPPPSYVEAPQQSTPSAAPSGRVTTELLGGPPPAAPATRPAAAAAPVNAPVYGADYGRMAPIPNPEDLSPAERARLSRQASPSATAYGSPALEGPARQPRRVRQPDRPRVATTARPAPRNVIAAPAGPVSPRPVAPAPKAKAAAPSVAAAKPAAPAKPAVVAAKPAAPAPKPAAPAAQVAAKPAAPVAAAKPAAPIAPAKPKTKAEQLGATLAAEVAAGSKLDIPAALGAGQEAVVVLSLPDTLLARTQAEAAKVGFTVPARTVDARAVLSGEGYTIIPNASQAARLKAGETTTFAWQVKPSAGAKGPLKAVVSGELKGGAKPQAFPITEIEQAVVAPAPAPVAKKGFSFKDLFAKKDKAVDATADAAAQAGDAVADGADAAKTEAKGILEALSLPGRPTIAVPGVGPVKSGGVVLAGLAALLVLLLAALGARSSAKRRAAERRRKFRTMADFNASETHEEAAAPVVHETHAVAEDDHPHDHEKKEHEPA